MRAAVALSTSLHSRRVSAGIRSLRIRDLFRVLLGSLRSVPWFLSLTCLSAQPWRACFCLDVNRMSLVYLILSVSVRGDKAKHREERGGRLWEPGWGWLLTSTGQPHQIKRGFSHEYQAQIKSGWIKIGGGWPRAGMLAQTHEVIQGPRLTVALAPSSPPWQVGGRCHPHGSE